MFDGVHNFYTRFFWYITRLKDGRMKNVDWDGDYEKLIRTFKLKFF